MAYNCSFRFLYSCLSIVDGPTSCHPVWYFTSSYTTLQMKCYSSLHWHKHLDPIAVDTIRSRGLPARHFTNSFFNFCRYYFNVLLLVSLYLFSCSLNPMCSFIVFYIFLPYSTPESSRFFLIRYYILFMWLSIQFLTELWLIGLEKSVFWYYFTLFLYHFRVAAFALIHCLSSSTVLLHPFLFTRYRWSTLFSDFPFSTFLSRIFQGD